MILCKIPFDRLASADQCGTPPVGGYFLLGIAKVAMRDREMPPLGQELIESIILEQQRLRAAKVGLEA